TALVAFESDGVKAQAFNIGHSADRHDELVDHQLLFGAAGIGIRHRDGLGSRLDFADLDTRMDDQALLGQRLLRLFGNLLVGNRQKIRHRFQDGDFGPQTAPYAAHLQADYTCPDNTQLLGNRRDTQGAIVGKYLCLIERQAGQFAWRRARGNDDVLGNQVFFCLARNLDGPAAVALRNEGTRAVKESYLVFLEQIQNAVIVLLYDGVFAAHQSVELQADAFDFDAMLGKMMVGLLKMLG